MKHLISLSTITSAIALSSQLTLADPVEISSDLNLVGFSGGTCNISVIPNANASSLNLDEEIFALDVATVETQCDYDYRVTVGGDTGLGGDFSLTNVSDAQSSVEYLAFVDGFPVFGFNGETEIGFFFAGDNRTMPVAIETFNFAPSPGIYQGNLTFSVIVD